MKRNCERALWAGSLTLLLSACGNDDKVENGSDAGDASPPANTDAGLQNDSGAGDAAACSALVAPDAAFECDQDGAVLAIAGEYTDEFGSSWSIDTCAINGDAVTDISNSDKYVVSQNSCADQFYPGRWSRNDWTWFSEDGGAPSLYLCTQVYDANSEAEALAAPHADATNPATGGCGLGEMTFAWSKLTPNGSGDGGTVDAGADSGADAGDGGAH